MEGEVASPALVMSADRFHHGSTPALTLDLVHLARQSLGDRALESELLQLFHRQAAHIIGRLADPAVADPKRRADLAHTLKGSARTVGAKAVAAAAERYEQAVSTPAGDASGALRALEQATSEARAAIEDLLAG